MNVGFTIMLIIFFLSGCGFQQHAEVVITKPVPEKLGPALHEKEPVERTQQITLTAIGDILIHDRVYDDAETADGYDFMPMLQDVAPYLDDTTITFANQETLIGGVELGLSGYPVFNSPVEIGEAVKEVGVDIVSMANNHTLDRGEEAVQRAIQHWEALKMMYVGAYKNFNDQQTQRIIETDEGISVGFIAYTYGTNGIQVPSGSEYLVNYIDRDVIRQDLAAMKRNADVTIVSLHFGNEYERMPSNEQKDLVQFVADEGANVVLGHHPHVLQPVEWVEGANGNEMLVIYSLGNFLSGQDELYRQIGGVLKFTIEKSPASEGANIAIKQPQFMPTFNASENEKHYRVLPLADVTDDVLPEAKKHYKEIQAHMSKWMPELEILEPEK